MTRKTRISIGGGVAAAALLTSIGVGLARPQPANLHANDSVMWVFRLAEAVAGGHDLPEALNSLAVDDLSLVSVVCETSGTVTVTIEKDATTDIIVGGQFFLSYDNTVLDFVSAEPAASVFTRQVYEAVDEGLGEIDYAVGVENEGTGTSSAATMATLTFLALDDEVCPGVPDLVAFRSHTPPTQLTDDQGSATLPNLIDLAALQIDEEDPVPVCPADVTVECDESTAPANTGSATATDNCDASPDITFDDSVAPGACADESVITRTWTATDDCGNFATCVQTITVDDSTAPVFDQACPLPAIAVVADAGGCGAAGTTVNPTTATATDNCDPAPAVTFVRSDGKPNLGDAYAAADSPITITWTATDRCGNSSQCTQTVTVDAVNELVLSLDLGGGIMPAGTYTRCITFEFWNCPGAVPLETVTKDVMFTDGSASMTLSVPCGDYNCVTAKDALHTLRRTDDALAIVSLQYVADFTGGDGLVGGNLNDDDWIDVLDFGIFIGQYGDSPGAGTPCGTPGPHADIDGSGLVWTEDYTFISANFLQTHEANCCSGPMSMRARRTPMPQSFNGPITRISVPELRRRGLHDLIAGDLNHDGWLDVRDMEAFAGGSRP